MDVFKEHGWTVKHVPTPMRPTKGGRFVPDSRGRGLLDLLLVHHDPPRLIWAECKTVGGVLSADQEEMLRLLRGVVDRVRQLDSGPCPLGAFVFAPGNEALIEALARGDA